MKLHHVHIRCQNLQASEDFYTKILGGEVVKRGQTKAGMAVIAIKMQDFAVSLSPKAESITQPVNQAPHWGIYQLGMVVDDLKATVADLTKKGVKFKGEIVEPIPGLLAAFCDDPDGTELELMQVL